MSGFQRDFAQVPPVLRRNCDAKSAGRFCNPLCAPGDRRDQGK
jgi:hypothetical protein